VAKPQIEKWRSFLYAPDRVAHVKGPT